MDPMTRKQFAAQVKGKYPQYANVPDDQLVDSIIAKYPQYKTSIIDKETLPPGEISTGPHGMNAVKSSLYKARDFVTNNLDTAGGIAGGLAGSTVGPWGALGGATLGGGAGRALTQLIKTSQGQPMDSSLEAAKDIAIHGGEQGLQELGGIGISKLGGLIKPASREALLAYGAKAGELGPQIKELLPELDKIASRTGEPKSVGDLEKLVETTERGMNQEFNSALFPIAQQPTAANSVGNAIRQQITPNMANTADGRAMRAYLQKRATEFDQGNWTIGSLNKERELITKRLQAYHKAISTGQVAQARVHANIAADTAAEQGLKDLLYTAADQSGTKPPGYFTALKKKQSKLITLADTVKASKEKLTKASMEREGAPLSEKIHLRSYLHPQSGAPGAVAGVNPSAFSDPLVRANSAISKGFPTGVQKVLRGARSAAAKAVSSPDVNALPLRALFLDTSEPQEAPK